MFVVGYLGDWRRAAAVLFERHSLSGHPAPSREKGPSVAALTANGVGTCGADDNQGQAGHLIPAGIGQGGETARSLTASHTATGRLDPNECTLIAHALKGEGFGASEDGTGRGTPIVPVAYRTTGNDGAYETGEQIGALTTSTDPNAQIIAFSAKDHGADAMSDLSPTLRAGGHSNSHANAGVMPAVAFSIMPMNSGKDFKGRETDVAPPVMAAGPAGGNQGGDYIVQSAVRRLTPRECERLQGFPDDYTLTPYRKGQAADGPRYKALGNSMAVPVMAWIGRRIAAVNALPHHQKAAA